MGYMPYAREARQEGKEKKPRTRIYSLHKINSCSNKLCEFFFFSMVNTKCAVNECTKVGGGNMPIENRTI